MTHKPIFIPLSFGGIFANEILNTPFAWGCAVCYGAVDSPLTQGLNFGILCLLTVLIFILSSFGAFFLNLRKRARTAKL
jgi:hypothetical protein